MKAAKLATNRAYTRKQRGLVAVLLLVSIAIAAVGVFSKNLWGGDAKSIQQKQTQAALKQAKDAVLAYVELGGIGDLSNANLLKKTNGRLPCPDQDGNGQATSAVEQPCGNVASSAFGAGYHSLGLLPWAQLGIPTLRDGANECLWIAIDGKFKINTPTSPLNSDADGSFSIIQPVKNAATGQWSESVLVGNPDNKVISDPSRVVAVIFAPNGPTGSQNRKPNPGNGSSQLQACTLPVLYAGNPNAQLSSIHYLESYSSSQSGLGGSNNTLTSVPNRTPLPSSANTALQTFVQADKDQEKLNDQLIWITAEEFSKAITKRTARIMASYINTYVSANGKYPPAAASAGGACVTTPKPLLQGYVPYSCPGNTRAGDMTMTSGTDRLFNDPDWWYGLSHYAVSETCITGGANPGAPCNGVATVNIGTGSPVSAIILMRGRARTGQLCPYTTGPLGTPNVSTCLEGTNAVVVNAANTTPAFAPASMAGKIYAVPDVKASNDYMVQFVSK